MNTNVITDVAQAEMHDTKYKNEHPGPVGGLGTGFLALSCSAFPVYFPVPVMVGWKTPSLKLFVDGQLLHSMDVLILLCACVGEQNGAAIRQQSCPIRETEITNMVPVGLEISLKEDEKVPPPPN